MKFLDPTNDVAFKKIFGNDQKKEILISFLNSLLGLKDLYFNFVELPKFNKNEQELKSAFETLQKYGWNKEELEVYDNIAMYRQDERGRIEQAKIDGEKIGVEKGKIEGKMEEKKEVAQSLSELGWTKVQIAKIIKVSEDEVGKHLE
ncbi:MAG TPA: hypothetical protein DHW82_09360 [Spirochaetia bacterium]|nr:MAG: hypothetical protein A2Y41_08410 [Spirochaetes bacterium GWB1_36_13]HCL57198.1 hypothetical protein [Spirochaetia bacterium]